MAIHPPKTKSTDFEAPKLSSPKMTFLGTLWKVQNLGFQVQNFENLKQTSIILGPKSIFSDPNFGLSGSRFGFSRSNFRKKVLREPGSKRSKIRPPGNLRNRLRRSQEALNSPLAMCSSHFEQFSTISTKIPKFCWGRLRLLRYDLCRGCHPTASFLCLA